MQKWRRTKVVNFLNTTLNILVYPYIQKSITRQRCVSVSRSANFAVPPIPFYINCSAVEPAHPTQIDFAGLLRLDWNLSRGTLETQDIGGFWSRYEFVVNLILLRHRKEIRVQAVSATLRCQRY